MLAFIFVRRGITDILVGACAPSLIRAVDLDEEMFGIVLVPYI
jgi:hypothetical protein